MEIIGDKKVFGGSFSYSVFKDANLQTISGDFANAQTGIVNPPTGSSSTTTTTTGGLVWQNGSIDTAGLSHSKIFQESIQT